MNPTLRAFCGTGVASAVAMMALWHTAEPVRSGPGTLKAGPPGPATGFALPSPASPYSPVLPRAHTETDTIGPTTQADRARAPNGLDPADRRSGDARSLDDMTFAEIERRLIRAAQKALAERDFQLDPRVVPAFQHADVIPIIVGAETATTPLESRLSGTRHGQLRRYRHVPFSALNAGPQALLELIQTGSVIAIELDVAHRATLIDTVPLIGAEAAWTSGFDGTNQVIAILDTGVDTTHPAFAGRIVDEACFSRRGHCPGGNRREFGPGTGAPCSFDCSHGTLVAGVALGADDQGDRHGVAPNAGLISIQIYSDEAEEPAAWTSDIVAALEHVYDLSSFHSIAVASLSLGGEAFTSQQTCDNRNSSRKAIIDLLRSAGIATVASSGNEGTSNSISAPACISSAISVGATRKNDRIAAFSNSAEFLSLLAPGSGVVTSAEGGGYSMASGTSIAAPHIAGAWAVIRQAAPDRSVDEIQFALQMTGVPILDSRNQVTTPRIDLIAAIEHLVGKASESDDPTEATESVSAEPATESPACGLVGLELGLLPLLLSARKLVRRRSGRLRSSD